MKIKMYRKLFVYKCEQCKKKRQTFKEIVFNGKICQKCVRTRVSKDQLNIFDALANRLL